MGKIVQGILGGFTGKVANVVGSSWKGIAVIKSLPLSVANPRTASQVNNRNSFSSVVAFAAIILVATIKPLLDRFAVKMSGYNLFVKLNKANFNADGVIDASALIIAQGSVTAYNGLGGTASTAGGSITAAWFDNSGDGDALADDVAYGIVVNTTKQEVANFPQDMTRADEAMSVEIPVGWETGDALTIVMAFRRADGTRTSNTNTDDFNIAA